MTDSFADTLRRMRQRAALTQQQLAERAGVSTRAVSDLERDPHRAPRLSTVALLVNALGLDEADEQELIAAARSTTAAGTPPASSGLPRVLTPLVGRGAEREVVSHLLDTPEVQLVTITGPGGVGKTRLAVAAAGSTDPDAVFVDLAPVRDAGLVLPTIARQLGVEDPARLTTALAGRHRLLVLDNFEQVLDARSEVLTLLRECVDLRVLITSRVALRVRGEREFRLVPLRTPSHDGAADPEDSAAYRLFVDRARSVGFDPTPDDAPIIAEICRRLDGLPLALELAAARLTVLDPTGLLENLTAGQPVLVDGPTDLPDRQRTMHDTVGWSHRLLSEPARAAFRRMSICAGGATLAGLERICEVPTAAITEVIAANLASLDRSESPPRVFMLEPVREFGLFALAEAGEVDRTARRHAESTLEDLARITAADLGNLRAAIGWAIGADETEMAHRLGARAVDAWLHLEVLSEGFTLLTEILRMPGADELDPHLQVPVAIGELQLANALWDTTTSTRIADRVVELADAHGTPAHRIRALIARGDHHRNLNRYRAAADDFRAARSLADATGDTDRARLEAMTRYAHMLIFLGRFTDAAPILAEAEAFAARADEPHAEATALVLRAWLDGHAGRIPEQVHKAERGVEIFRRLGDTGRLAETLRVLGDGLSYGSEPALALAAFSEARALYARRGEDHLVGQVDSQISYVVYQLGDIPRATRLASDALAMGRRYGDLWAIAMCTTILGHFALATGELAAARQHLTESAEAFEQIGNPIYLAWNLEGRAVLAWFEDDPAEAARLLAETDAVRRRLQSKLPPIDRARVDEVRSAVRQHRSPPP